jgi:hypothetical protein
MFVRAGPVTFSLCNLFASGERRQRQTLSLYTVIIIVAHVGASVAACAHSRMHACMHVTCMHAKVDVRD